jgi:hypothetical protein
MKVSMFFFCLCFYACTTASNDKEQPSEPLLRADNQSRYDTVGAKHDTAMLLMKEIASCQYRLRNSLELAKKEGSSAQKEVILEGLLALQKAEDAMMGWMRAFKGVDLEEAFYKNQTEKAVLHYLQEEEIKIEQVHRQMKASIELAQRLLIQ